MPKNKGREVDRVAVDRLYVHTFVILFENFDDCALVECKVLRFLMGVMKLATILIKIEWAFAG